MEEGRILKWLNWFYSLEVSQVNFYLTQAKNSEDDYIAEVLLALSKNEVEHAEKIANYIRKFGGTPIKIGNLLSYMSGIVAKTTPLVGTVNLFTINYEIETVAIHDYKNFIKKMDPAKRYRQELIDGLMANLIDEDLHRSWFLSRRESLKRLNNEAEMKI